MFSITILLLNALLAGCAENSNAETCTGDCFWNPGSCVPFESSDCTLGSCSRGCAHTDYHAGSCSPTLECDLSEGACTGNCAWNAKSCVSLETYPTCGVVGAHQSCPEGCERDFVNPSCEPRNINYGGTDCYALDATTPLMDCTYNSDCKWTGSCVRKTEGEGEDYCQQLSNTTIADCGMFCTVSGGACVYNTELCSAFSTTANPSECASNADCKIVGGNCVGIQAKDNDDCSKYEVTSFSDCEVNYPICKKAGDSCVSGFDDYCGEVVGMEHCGKIDLCTVVGSKCMFAGNGYCDQFSTVPLTECSAHSSSCKTEKDINGNSLCKNKTSAELCAQLSLVRYSQCEFENNECEVKEGDCVAKDPKDVSYCTGRSTALIHSECESSYYPKCQVSSSGLSCELAPEVVCELNLGKTDCNVPDPEFCEFVAENSINCKNSVTCGNLDDDACEDETTCELALSGKCVPSSSVVCSANVDGSCAEGSTGCTSTPEQIESCGVNIAITAELCGVAEKSTCGVSDGCKWNSATGGKCVAKNCSNSPSYARCCLQGASQPCAYCDGSPKPSDCPIQAPSCSSSPSYVHCCPGTECTGFCQANPTEAGCALAATCSSTPSYSNCCPGVTCQGFCSSHATDPDCLANACISVPSYANCCPGDKCTGFCQSNPTEAGCVKAVTCESEPSYSNCCPGVSCDAFCSANPDAEGCPKDSALSVKYKTAVLLFALFIALLF